MRILSVAALAFVLVANFASAKNRAPSSDLEQRVTDLETRLDALEKKLPASAPTLIPSCKDFLLSADKDRPGMKCQTSKGAIFERVAHATLGVAWLAPGRIVWSDILGTDNFAGASSLCAKNKMNLPALNTWDTAEGLGIREVVATIVLKSSERPMVDTYYWSRTPMDGSDKNRIAYSTFKVSWQGAGTNEIISVSSKSFEGITSNVPGQIVCVGRP